jgi:hypothetical protein
MEFPVRQTDVVSKRVQCAVVIAMIMPGLLPAAALGAATRRTPAVSLGSFTARIDGLAFTEAPFTCRTSPPRHASVDSESLIREYLRTRRLPDAPDTRAFLDALLDYQRWATEARLEVLIQRQTAIGLSPLVAEDVARCVTSHSPWRPDRFTEHAQAVAAIKPAPIGLFWAAMNIMWREGQVPALEYFQQALAADPQNARTRLFYAVTLVNARRFVDALTVLEPMPRDRAPEATAYWRASALMALHRTHEARALLERLPLWVHSFDTSAVDAFDALPVSLPTVPGCAIAMTYGLEGDFARARAMLVAIKNCPNDLMELELRSGHPYRVVEIYEEGFQSGNPALVIEALARLRACEWAWQLFGYAKSDPSLDNLRRTVEGRCPVRRERTTDNALLARVAAPRSKPYIEVPLEAISNVEPWQLQPRLPRDIPYPALAKFPIVTISPPARTMFAVSLSDAVHPTRYAWNDLWVHVSSDGGEHWDGPYYLGLSGRIQDYARFIAHTPSSRGRRLPLEVQSLHTASPSRSPTSQRRMTTVARYRIDIDLDAIRRDSDSDGLTDLLEEKLLLDPHVRDTDGDGIEDGADRLPLQPRGADVRSDASDVWAVLLEVLAGDRHLPDGRVPLSGRQLAPADARPFRNERTLFVRSPHCPVTHASPIRVICLGPDVLEKYDAKFKGLSPMDLSQVVFDETRQHALVRYAYPFGGGTLRATKRNGEWLFQSLSKWVE